MSTYCGVNVCLAQCLNSVLNVKALVGAFKQEKVLMGAFSVIVKTDCETDGSSAALMQSHPLLSPPAAHNWHHNTVVPLHVSMFAMKSNYFPWKTPEFQSTYLQFQYCMYCMCVHRTLGGSFSNMNRNVGQTSSMFPICSQFRMHTSSEEGLFMQFIFYSNSYTDT